MASRPAGVESLKDAPVEILARYASALQLCIRQSGQLGIQGGCGVSVGAGGIDLCDACAEPLAPISPLMESPTDWCQRGVRVCLTLHDASPAEACAATHA
jgi:hypothetical protein